MYSGLTHSSTNENHYFYTNPDVIVVSLSVSGSRLGGAAIAAEWHSRFLGDFYRVELWRMWDEDSSVKIGNLLIRNFKTKIKFPRLTSYLPRRAKALMFRSEILNQILKVKPKIVHLQNPGPALEFERIARTCKRHGIHVVASTHGFYEVFYPNYGWKWYERYGWNQWMKKPIQRSLKYLDGLVSGYPIEKKILLREKVEEQKIHLVPNGINPYFEDSPSSDEYISVLNKFDIHTKHPILLFIGNHTSNKGIDTVLEVATRLKTPSTVVIGGKLLSPDEPQQRLDQIKDPGLSHIIFTDYLTDMEQRVLYHAANILLFPSLADTLPLTILEAMACGLPVIAYDTGGISYQLDNCSGIIIQQGNVDDFIQATQTLLANTKRQKEIGENAKLRQKELFSWKLAAEKTSEIYNLLSAP